jgi:hypothetical protein
VGKAERIVASTNGRDWVERERVTTAQINGVHFAHDHFIVAGKNGALLRSKNGLEWVDARSLAFPAAQAEGVKNDDKVREAHSQGGDDGAKKAEGCHWDRCGIVEKSPE